MNLSSLQLGVSHQGPRLLVALKGCLKVKLRCNLLTMVVVVSSMWASNSAFVDLLVSDMVSVTKVNGTVVIGVINV